MEDGQKCGAKFGTFMELWVIPSFFIVCFAHFNEVRHELHSLHFTSLHFTSLRYQVRHMLASSVT